MERLGTEIPADVLPPPELLDALEETLGTLRDFTERLRQATRETEEAG